MIPVPKTNRAPTCLRYHPRRPKGGPGSAARRIGILESNTPGTASRSAIGEGIILALELGAIVVSWDSTAVDDRRAGDIQNAGCRYWRLRYQLAEGQYRCELK